MGLARLLARVFFRDVEVVRDEPLPGGVPLLIVANHVNSFVDPVLLLGFVGAPPRFLAKHTLWWNPVVGPLLVVSAAVPVYRRQDGADVSRNFDTFARCRKTLAAGGVVAVFPEGTSHNQPHAMPLKTGAARIVLEAEQRHGPLQSRIVPVGLTYEAKGRFRSRVLLRVGRSIDPSPEVARYASDGRGAVRELTGRIAAALDEVTLGHASWEEARLADLAATLVTGDRFERPLSEMWSARKSAVLGYRALAREDPARAAAVVFAVARYDRYLRSLELTDTEVARGNQAAGPTERRSRPVALLVVAAAVGTLLNWLPYFLPGWVARRLSRTADEPATYKLLTALLAFPVVWALEAAGAWAIGGWPFAVAVAVLAPLTGWIALAFHEERGRFFPAKDFRRRPAIPEEALRALTAEREALRKQLLAVSAGDRRLETAASGPPPRA